MKRLTGILLIVLLVFSLSAAMAQRVECATGGFSVKLPDHFVEQGEIPALFKLLKIDGESVAKQIMEKV